MYLVDTNVLSEARRGRPEARDWLRSVDPDQVFLSVVTLGEIMKGISQKTRTDAAQRSRCIVGLSSCASTTRGGSCRSAMRLHLSGAGSPPCVRRTWATR